MLRLYTWMRNGGAAFVCLVVLAACEWPQAGERIELDVPYIAQETLLCVPTSAAMIMAFYGSPEAPRKLKALSAGREYHAGASFNDFTITSYDGLVRGVGALGYHWSSENLPASHGGFVEGMARIKADLRQGRPTMVDISYQGVGHTFVVTGFDERERIISFVDPGAPKPGRKSATYEQFEAVWNESAYGGDFRSMVRTRSRSN